jgi:hypothetical protein
MTMHRSRFSDGVLNLAAALREAGSCNSFDAKPAAKVSRSSFAGLSRQRTSSLWTSGSEDDGTTSDPDGGVARMRARIDGSRLSQDAAAASPAVARRTSLPARRRRVSLRLPRVSVVMASVSPTELQDNFMEPCDEEDSEDDADGLGLDDLSDDLDGLNLSLSCPRLFYNALADEDDDDESSVRYAAVAAAAAGTSGRAWPASACLSPLFDAAGSDFRARSVSPLEVVGVATTQPSNVFVFPDLPEAGPSTESPPALQGDAGGAFAATQQSLRSAAGAGALPPRRRAPRPRAQSASSAAPRAQRPGSSAGAVHELPASSESQPQDAVTVYPWLEMLPPLPARRGSLDGGAIALLRLRLEAAGREKIAKHLSHTNTLISYKENRMRADLASAGGPRTSRGADSRRASSDAEEHAQMREQRHGALMDFIFRQLARQRHLELELLDELHAFRLGQVPSIRQDTIAELETQHEHDRAAVQAFFSEQQLRLQAFDLKQYRSSATF